MTTYTELKTQIASYLHRTDLTSVIPTFIVLAESFIFRELHVKEMQISVTGTTVGGYVTLPSDFGSVGRITVQYSGYERNLDYKAQAQYSTTVEVFPLYYSLENNKLRIWGSGDGQAYTLYYIPAIPALSDTNTTNWLLTNAAELYLYASALEGAKHIRDTNQVQVLTEQVSASLDSVKRFTERRGQPSLGSMQIRPRRRG
jgi:hypothetical protein